MTGAGFAVLAGFRAAALAAIIGLLVAGCAKQPERQSRTMHSDATRYIEASYRTAAQTAFVQPAAAIDHFATASIDAADPLTSRHGLAGRTLRVASIADIDLKPREVILTFDDGPHAKMTPKVLAALAEYGVKATFFMVGDRAAANPAMVRRVADAGHTIGSHTRSHENLANLGQAEALEAINAGEAALAAALAPSGRKPAPFFRFPYLAQTRLLRAGLNDMGLVVFDVDVDSLDFKKETSATVLERTLARLDRKGGGIVLFHDIHARTAALLPEFLAALEARGYKVVHAVPGTRSPFDIPLTVASR